MLYSFKGLPVSVPTTEEDIRALAYQMSEHSKALQELPLILVREDIGGELTVPEDVINQWMARAEQDQQLRIERRWIPYTEVHIPDTPIGIEFFNIAKNDCLRASQGN